MTSVTAAERILMGSRMFDAARAMVLASFPPDGCYSTRSLVRSATPRSAPGSNHSEDMRMRTLLLPALFALGVGLTGIVSASAMIGPGSRGSQAFLQ